MSAERLARAEELFFAALERPPSEREEHLRALCPEDGELRSEVLRLLAAHHAADAERSFLETPPLAREEAEDAGAPQLAAGEQLGAYRLVREIGRGGMGAVYLAERADEEYRRQVAIKVIRRGLGSETLEQRFRRERQILAWLDHPNIAGLLDGGTTRDGISFLVMEVVEGEPIDVYCDRCRLSIDERLELFQQVCAAVSYAHQRLVIHRDLKPSNVLVGQDGVPKLLDFGIAKLLDADTGEDPLQTATGLRLLTPQYASPEQVLGQPVTTASDVYSLGVVLYELLTGRLPYQLTSRELPEVARVVAGAEIERPSDAVRRPPESGAEAVDPSTVREGSVLRLRRRLRGDLDNVVLHALRREPARRYQSVEQLAGDLRRHQRGLPVLARPDTVGYRFAKFARRNRAAVVVAGLLLLTLVLGLLATAWQARRATKAQHRAERRFAEVRALARSVLFDYHDAIRDLPGATPVRQRLVKDALHYFDGLAAETADDPSLERELAAAYERLSEVQGGHTKANLGDTEGAIASQRKAMRIREALLRRDPSSRELRLELALCQRALSALEAEAGAMTAVLSLRRSSLGLLEGLAAESGGSEVSLDLARGLDALGDALGEAGDFTAARSMIEQSLVTLATLPEPERTSVAARRAASVATEHLALVQLQLGQAEEALLTNERAMQLRAALAAEQPLNTDAQRVFALSYYNQGQIEEQLGRRADALASYERALALAEKLTAVDPANALFRSDESYALVRASIQHAALGDAARSLAYLERARDLRAADAAADSANQVVRASLIEVGTRLCSVSADAGRAAARAECDAVRGQLAAEPAEGFAYIRGFYADSWALLGNAYRALAARAQGDGERDLLAARACFEASRDILQGLAREIELPGDSAALLREVTAALEQLPAPSASTPAAPGR